MAAGSQGQHSGGWSQWLTQPGLIPSAPYRARPSPSRSPVCSHNASMWVLHGYSGKCLESISPVPGPCWTRKAWRPREPARPAPGTFHLHPAIWHHLCPSACGFLGRQSLL